MVAIARSIIRQRMGTFDPSTYRDRYQEALGLGVRRSERRRKALLRRGTRWLY